MDQSDKIDGIITPSEKLELSELALLNENQQTLHELLRRAWEGTRNYEDLPLEASDRILEKILKPQPVTNPLPVTSRQPAKVRWLWVKRFAVAASITGLIFSGYILLKPKPAKNITTREIAGTKNIPPGGNKAVLTLGNGSRIILDSAQNGILGQQGKTTIVKTDSGKLAYNASTEKLNTKTTAVVYNTLTTPRGGQYQLTLLDGTRVWLNAASSIIYPTAFNGTSREVEVSGEVYFEVQHNAKMPFKVKVNNELIEDIGTSFNINAYTDESGMRITLVQGAINVLTTAGSRQISPNEQALILNDQLTVIKEVDVNKVIAWKKGLFEFNQTTLPVIMRQISRWYDVDIYYEGTVSTETFGGGISRNLPLSDVLKLLETNGVKFRLEGKQLFVNYKPAQ